MRNFFINLGQRAGVTDLEMKYLVNHKTDNNVTSEYAGLRNDFEYLLKNTQKITDFIMKECGVSKGIFGIEQKETNELENALDILKSLDPKILKLALEMSAKSKE